MSPLVYFHVVSEYRSSSDYHTGAMVDGERFADCGRGVYVDTGLTVGALADHARYDRHAELHKLVGDTVVGYGLDAGIAVYHFLYGIGGRSPWYVASTSVLSTRRSSGRASL